MTNGLGMQRPHDMRFYASNLQFFRTKLKTKQGALNRLLLEDKLTTFLLNGMKKAS